MGFLRNLHVCAVLILLSPLVLLVLVSVLLYLAALSVSRTTILGFYDIREDCGVGMAVLCALALCCIGIAVNDSPLQ